MARNLVVFCVLFVLAATPAQAAEFVIGDGYGLQIPIGYEKVDVRAVNAVDAMRRVSQTLPTRGEPQTFVFFKGEQLAPEGTVVVLRGSTGTELTGNPLDVIEERIRKIKGDLGVSGVHAVRRRVVDGYEGVELSIRGVRVDSKEPRHLHLLVVPAGSFLMSVLMIHKPADGLASDDWADMVATLQMHAPHDALRLLLTWGGATLVGLFVLLFLIRLARGAPAGRRVDFSRAGETLLSGPSAYEGAAAQPAGPGVTRAHDGLPIFHGGSGAPPASGRTPSAPGGSPAASFTPDRRPPGHPTAPSLPGLKPTNTGRQGR